ncbi:hypothetical protein AX17_004977 [Amanita inopinata Kibby_2008]|nr:hypothetical protein AX17_004977 [Amanita inopinata Kibby_2008]
MIPETEQMRQVLQLPDKVWSNVEELRLPSADMRMDAYPVLFSPGVDLSKLRSLVTRGYWNGLHPDALVPWHQLRQLDLSAPIPLSVCLDVLRQAMLLEHCVIQIGASNGMLLWDQQAGTITLPNLGVLALNFTSGEDAKPFLDLLTLPNLTTLEVYSIESLLDCDETTFAELACRSGGMKRLEGLRIGGTVSWLSTAVFRRNMPRLKYVG